MHGNTMANAWQPHGKCTALAWGNAWQTHGNSMANAWQPLGDRNLSPRTRRRCLDALRAGKRMANASQDLSYKCVAIYFKLGWLKVNLTI